jgi:hypothetical protein
LIKSWYTLKPFAVTQNLSADRLLQALANRDRGDAICWSMPSLLAALKTANDDADATPTEQRPSTTGPSPR